MGTIPWSPSYKRINMEMEYWRMRKSHKLGLHRNVRQLLVLQNKLKIKYVSNMNLTMIEYKIRMVYAERKKVIKMAESLSLEYRTKLALAKEEAGERKAATYLRNLNRIEGQRKLF